MGETCMVWPNDGHCPVDVEDVFPQGIPGITITPTEGERCARPRRGPIIGLPEAWRRVWASFVPADLGHHPCGIHFRGFHPGGKPWEVFSEEVRRFADSTEGEVFVLADSRRDEIRDILGARMVDPVAVPLGFDFDRNREQVLNHLRDWRTFVLTGSVITNHRGSAAMWARRFF